MKQNQLLKKIQVIFLIAAVLLSYGFEWPWDQKKPKPPKNTQSTPLEVKQVEVKKEEISAPAPIETKKEASKEDVEREVNVEPVQPAKTEVSGIVQTKLDPDAEVQKIQAELQEVIKQTKIIETQSGADRARLQKIIQQVQVQKKLIDALKMPKPVAVPQTVVNSEEILRTTKIRLIGEEIKKTRQSLDAVKPAQTIVQQPPKVYKKQTS